VFAAMVKLALLHQEQRADLADALADLSDARAVRATEEAEAAAHADERARQRAAAEADRDAAQQAERDAAEARQRATEMTQRAATPAATTKPSRSSGHGKRGSATKQERVAWAVTQLAAGTDLRPRDIDERFGDPRNGWDVLRKAREQHEQRRPVSLVREA
jgi:colicin import membrane protein